MVQLTPELIIPNRRTEDDRSFVLDNINRCLNLDTPLSRDDIISERCGVRPLVVESEGAVEAD